jgi:hypothetical protein
MINFFLSQGFFHGIGRKNPIVEEQIQKVERMNKKLIMLLTTMFVLLIGAGADVVCAKALGDDFSVMGYNLGWILLGIGVFVGLLFIILKSAKLVTGKATKAFVLPVIIILLLGIALVGVQYEPAATGQVVGTECPVFKITATPVITGNNYIGGTSGNADPQWDKDNLVYTVPIKIDSAANGRLNESIIALNFTLDPLSTSDMTADTMATIHMKSDYDTVYNDKDVFSKFNNYYCVNWTSDAGTVSYEDSQDMQVSNTGWALCTWQLNNNSATNWVNQLSAVGNCLSFYVTFWNDCYSRSETITVTLIVVGYTA